MDELIIKDAIEPLTCGVGFYCNIFVVTKYMDDLHDILNLK